MNAEYEVGEIVSMLVHGRVVEIDESRIVIERTRHSAGMIEIPLPAKISREEPKGGPPRAGEVWIDRTGASWFVQEHGTPGTAQVQLIPMRVGVFEASTWQMLHRSNDTGPIRRAWSPDE